MKTFTFIVLIPILTGATTTIFNVGPLDGVQGILLNFSICTISATINSITD